MADPRRRVRVGPFHVRVASGKLFLPDDVASRIENMCPTEEGTLRSVVGPAPYVPIIGSHGGAPPSAAVPNAATPEYGTTMRGIFHCLLKEGQREVLLLHTVDQIWTFQGWNHRAVGGSAWKELIGRTELYLPTDNRVRFPTQFVATPTGVVIVPQDARAYFYDGEVALPLGFSERPGAPVGLGPESGGYAYSEAAAGWVNNQGYAHDALGGMTSAMSLEFKLGRIGTTVQSGGSTDWSESLDSTPPPGDGGAGWLEPGTWRYAVQFIDQWGNLSPLSGESKEVRVQRQPSYWFNSSAGAYGPTVVDRVRKQFACTSIATGPLGTVGRILYRTKDLINSGSTDFYEVPLNATESADAFATMPDNVSTVYPDNIPDFWLVRKPVRPVMLRPFKIAALSFGRLWAANFDGSPGMVRPSMIGRWGTFLENEEIFPDPEGGEITGLLTAANGLLVFTETSTYRIEPYYDGEGFRSMSVSQTVGCDSPSSTQTLPDGRSIWKGRDGFYAYDGTAIKSVSHDLSVPWKRHNAARAKQAVSAVDPTAGVYRCWVAIDGGRENTRCYEYDGLGWRIRTDVAASSACTTKDHRKYMLAAGKSDTNYGVWILDHQVKSYEPSTVLDRAARVETAWISAATSQTRKTTYQVRLWLIEHGSSNLTVQVQRDWRNTVLETHEVPKNPTDDAPPFWGTAVLDASDTTWRKRRPYWRKVQIYVPSAEVFKLVIKGSGRWEFVGFQVEEAQHHVGGSRTPP